MAQPVYDKHPLEQYLQQAGEVEFMPGGTPDFAPVEDGSDGEMEGTADGEAVVICLPPIVGEIVEIVSSLMHTQRNGQQHRELAERFKYDVISSTLLAPGLASPNPARRPATPDFPGRLHSRESSLTRPAFPGPPHAAPRVIPSPAAHAAAQNFEERWTLILSCVACFAAFARLYLLAAVLLGGALYPYFPSLTVPHKTEPIAPAIEDLEQLISAGRVWDSAVQEAMTVLERQERDLYYTASPMSPSAAPLRVALNSSLHTTRTQCEKVRHLFAALTSPGDLSQLSEMYSPPSPNVPTLVPLSAGMQTEFQFPPAPMSAPASSSARRRRTISTPSSPADNRATWNGSYASLASAGSPTMQALRRREKRRSDLSAILHGSAWMSTSSAPVTPGLAEVREEGEYERERRRVPQTPEYFGADALGLHKRRRAKGLRSLGLASPPPSYSTATSAHAGARTLGLGLGLGGAVSPPSTISLASAGARLTPVHTSRHPLSLGALHHALQAALAAKRHACAHLLALRFEDEDAGAAEEYWGDVRAVMALLTSTFADASAHLVEALDDVERVRAADEVPSLPSHSRNVSVSSSSAEDDQPTIGRSAGRATMQQMIGFAPMPSNIVRFGTHVDAISSALDEARDYLRQTVTSLRDEPAAAAEGEDSTSRLQEAPAMKAYERLRRELGYALRECERGRERLLDILAAAHGPSAAESEEEVPLLGADAGSEESSDKPASVDQPASPGAVLSMLRGDADAGVVVVGAGEDEDDASAHLLNGTSARQLPPPGVEQVFEGESGTGGAFARERSKVPREERIRLAKARRVSGGGGGARWDTGSAPPSPSPMSSSKGGVERWGPGGDVVQELKDVIWKVGERRRKLAEQEAAVHLETSASSPTSDGDA